MSPGMDFFSYQDDAKKKSRVFFIAFFGAVILAVFILYFVVTGCIGVLYFSYSSMRNGFLPAFIYGAPAEVLAWGPFLKIAPLLFLTIFLISLTRSVAIKRGGGAYIAEMLGGVQLEQPRDQKERQFLNVVEEMALASGLPRPRLYILVDENSINAVTAGLDHEDTIIAVTQGALDHFDRAELQAVVAHEFAHILNGDYALNLTMAGWLYGLLFFSARGKDLINMAGKLEGRVSGIPMFLGLILWAGGWAGKLSAQLLEAAFSRQREYLADAFAAQFTRNPPGLADALKKIAGLRARGALSSGQALALKSFFIVSPARRAGGLLRSHPPLEKRIERLDPNWDGDIPVIKPMTAAQRRSKAEASAAINPAPGPYNPGGGPARARAGMEISPEAWAASLAVLAAGGSGRVRGDEGISKERERVWASDELSEYQKRLALGSLEATHNFLSSMPEPLRQAATDPIDLPALMLALFMQNEDNLQKRQLQLISHFLNERTAARASYFKSLINDQMRLPLLSFSAPMLKQVRPEIKRGLMRASTALLGEDGRAGMFEAAALRLLNKYLGFKKPPAEIGDTAAAFADDVVTALSFAAVAGCADPKIARQAFAAGAAHFTDWPPMIPRIGSAVDSHKLEESLDRLVYADEKLRRRILLAVADVVTYDHVLTEIEYDILRSLAAVLEMPLPYLTQSQEGA